MLDNEEYLDKHYESQFTCYDFMILFSAVCAIKDIHCFSKENLIDYIVNIKKMHQYEEILNDISIRNNGIIYYSNDLEDAVSKLKSVGLLYTISSLKESTVFICDDLDISKMIESKVRYVTELVKFVTDYQKNETKKVMNASNDLYEREDRDIHSAVLSLKKEMSYSK